ncbi:MAG: extracellular solute-binding protein, partial [Spirochaetales bacterium]|nr:extracellular solute-binding protein [Spirochaetales bacterium]
MKIKKLFVLLLALLCMTSLFAQAATETKTSGPRIVTFWSLFTGGDGEFFDAIIDEFNKTHTDIQLKNDTVKFDDYYTKLTAALAAGNAPDMIVCHQG